MKGVQNMKRVKVIMLVAFIILCMFSSIIYAAETTYFCDLKQNNKYLELNEQDSIDTYGEDWKQLKKAPFKRRKITSFAVLDNGEILIATKCGLFSPVIIGCIGNDNKLEAYYSSEGGADNYLVAEHNKCVIISNRGLTAIEFLKTGEVKKIYKFVGSASQAEEIRTAVSRVEKSLNGDKYYLSQNGEEISESRDSYTYLIREDSNGEKTVLYDAHKEAIIQKNLLLCAIIILLYFTITTLIKEVKKHTKN